ncbi:MAG: hypothetical protein B7Z22_05410 [Hyphomonas sp. 32-62-5]|nr:MAG: hypothetical protein B7Z22_05410 [Hyphomonas sp. 32-62-5]
MNIRKLALAAALFVGLTNMAGAAFAQAKVYVVNETKVMADSKLGKAMAAQLTQDANAVVDQLGLKALQTEVQTERAALQPQTQSLTPEAIAANPTLKSRVDALNRKVNELVQKSNALDQGLDQQRSVNQIAFNYVLVPAVEAVAKEMGADVVLSYNTTLYNKDSIDITAKVVSRLDSTVPTLEALKAALPQPPAAPAAGAPGGG